MFENFVPIANPDNRHAYLEKDEQDDIIIGGTCKHIFIIPTNYTLDTIVKDITAFYKQGLYVLIERSKSDTANFVITPIAGTNMSRIEITLNPYDTDIFRKNGLDTFVQLKIIKQTDEVIYTEPRKLVVREPLDR